MTTKRHLTKYKTEKRAADNTGLAKVAVQWLNQALCFYQSLCMVDSEMLRNRHLRVAAIRQAVKKLLFFTIFHPKLLFYFRFKSL
jgi:hypothetical protein